MRRALAITLALFAVLLAVVLERYAPPPAVPKSADVGVFSAERAREVQEKLVGDGSTRWVGTAGNARARAYLASELQRSGWTVETQKAFSCTYHGACARVENVVAKLEGKNPAIAGVLVSAHFDSVPVSPGAMDDGVGVAVVLEMARALAAGPRPSRTVIALLTDGEEAGLLGADAFVRGHPAVGNIKHTINVDSRGGRGPSQMFETSAGNAGVIALVSSKLDRPVTTSLFYEVYKRLPNDTDFSLTKTVGSGVNFANTAGIENYHTPLDALEHADLGTLQHHGDHVLAMARAFADTDGSVRSDLGTDAVWFDVLALFIVHWPAQWTVLMGLVALALLVLRAYRARVFDRGFLVFFPQLVAGALACELAAFLLKTAGALPAYFLASPHAAEAAVHLAGAAAALAVGFAFVARSKPRALWFGTWIAWAGIGTAVANVAPGVAYLFVVPAVIAAALGSLSFEIALVAPAVVAGVLVLPLAVSLYEGVGFVAAPAIGVPTILLASTIVPMLPVVSKRIARAIPLALAVSSALAIVFAMNATKCSATVPQRVNVVFKQTEKDARVYIDNSWGPSLWGAPPPSMLEAAGAKASAIEASLPWGLPVPFATVPAVDMHAPVFAVGEKSAAGDHRKMRIHVESRPNATSVALVFPPQRHVELKVDGHFAAPRNYGAKGQILAVHGPSPLKFDLDVDIADVEPLPVTAIDRAFGVPPNTKAAAAVGARPPTAVQSQDGDVTVFEVATTL